MKDIVIKDIVISPPLILAPMAGITNLAYRKMMKKHNVGLVVSEMVSDYALIYGNKETFKMLETLKEERPLSIQLFGSSKESLVKAVKILNRFDFDILDINLGCPVPKVVKEGSGASWLKKERQEELFDTMQEIVKNSNKPVTCKIRLGWDHDEITVIETCQILERSGVSLIAIHGRTRSDFYSGRADYQWIKKAKEAVNIPLVANGDIFKAEDAFEVLNITKSDGLMIGRGALGNPQLFDNIVKKEKGLPFNEEIVLEQQIEFCKEHYRNLIDLKGEYRASQEMRGLAPHYFKGLKNAKKIRLALSKINNYEDFERLLLNIEL